MPFVHKFHSAVLSGVPTGSWGTTRNISALKDSLSGGETNREVDTLQCSVIKHCNDKYIQDAAGVTDEAMLEWCSVSIKRFLIVEGVAVRSS